MSVVHDWRCDDCDGVMEARGSREHPPACPACEEPMRITWERGQCPTIDLYSAPQYSDATGEWHSSQREKARAMQALGYHEAGDKEHGARNTLEIRGTGFSYRDQASHTSTSEQSRVRESR